MIIIKKPVITEKMTAISEKLNKFAFIVDKNANKYQIKDAIEKLYDVRFVIPENSEYCTAIGAALSYVNQQQAAVAAQCKQVLL